MRRFALRGIVVDMKPITVSVDVPQPRDRVFAFLDVMRNHERFTDHMLTNWQYEGPARGVGSTARVRPRSRARPTRSSSRRSRARRRARSSSTTSAPGAAGRASGSYSLVPLPTGGTRVSFEYAWREAPRSERLLSPLVRAVMRPPLQRSMQRLAEQLGASDGGTR